MRAKTNSKVTSTFRPNLNDRLSASAAARKALFENFKVKRDDLVVLTRRGALKEIREARGTPMPNRAAAARRLIPCFSTASTTRTRKSRDNGAAIAAGLQSSSNAESHLKPIRNPSRVGLRG
jgi:hypothetical protein